MWLAEEAVQPICRRILERAIGEEGAGLKLVLAADRFKIFTSDGAQLYWTLLLSCHFRYLPSFHQRILLFSLYYVT